MLVLAHFGLYSLLSIIHEGESSSSSSSSSHGSDIDLLSNDKYPRPSPSADGRVSETDCCIKRCNSLSSEDESGAALASKASEEVAGAAAPLDREEAALDRAEAATTRSQNQQENRRVLTRPCPKPVSCCAVAFTGAASDSHPCARRPTLRMRTNAAPHNWQSHALTNHKMAHPSCCV